MPPSDADDSELRLADDIVPEGKAESGHPMNSEHGPPWPPDLLVLKTTTDNHQNAR